MDLRVFYQKMRKLESQIPDAHVVMVSLETADGGKAGRMTEVMRETAARLVIEGRARMASEEEAAEFRKTLEPAPYEPAGPNIDTRALNEALRKAVKENLRTLQE
jgi:hypothetical protein